jgi:UDP-galactopyranose mutase
VSKTVITKEYPDTWEPGKTAYYPIADDQNQQKYEKYKARAESELRLVLGGRLGEYRYYDMDQVIASAMAKAKKFI